MDALVLVLNVFEFNASVSMASVILHRELKNILLQKESRASRLFVEQDERSTEQINLQIFSGSQDIV